MGKNKSSVSVTSAHTTVILERIWLLAVRMRLNLYHLEGKTYGALEVDGAVCCGCVSSMVVVVEDFSLGVDWFSLSRACPCMSESDSGLCPGASSLRNSARSIFMVCRCGRLWVLLAFSCPLV